MTSDASMLAVARHPWVETLCRVRAEALDCLQTSMALIADHAYGEGSHLVLGCSWQLGTGQNEGLTSVQRPLTHRLREASKLLGLRTRGQWTSADGPAVRRLLTGQGPLYIVADAHDLPWLPYAGHQHMEHGFLLQAEADGWLVVDAYHNDTAWGPARPGTWILTTSGLDRALANGVSVTDLRPAVTPPAVHAETAIAENAARAAASAPEIDRYVTAVRAQLDQPGAPEQLVLDIWLLGREQALYATWLSERTQQSQAGAAAQDRTAAWRQLAAQSYVALRRTQRGAPIPDTLLDDLLEQLHADRAAAADLASVTGTQESTEPPRPWGGHDVRGTVVGELSTVLGVDGQVIEAVAVLRDVPGFNSFRLVEAIDRIEARLGTQLPGRISARDLHDVTALCNMFAAATTPAEGAK